MSVPLPGLHVEDPFAGRLAARLQPGALEVVSLPPGHAAEDALASCLQAAGGASVAVAELSGGEASSWVGCFEDALGLARTGATRASRMVEAALRSFTWPRTLIAIVPDPVIAPAVIQLGREVAELTRNLDGAISVLVLLTEGAAGADENAGCWAPLVASIMPAVAPVKVSGREIYLSLRVYWEAAGRPTVMRDLDAARAVAASSTVADLDARLDAAFDRWSHGEVPASAIRLLAETVDAHRGPLIRLGFAASIPNAVTLERSGVLWRAPGHDLLFLTSAAARSMSRTHPELISGAGSTAERLRAAVRHSPMIGVWVFGMTSRIQRRLQWACAARPELVEQLVSMRGLADELATRRSAAPERFLTTRPAALVDHASFAELITLVEHPELRGLVPLSAKLLNDVRLIRNLSAHLHPIGWPAVERVLEAVDALET